MRTFLHFLKSNIRYNKVELGISYFITFLVISLFEYFRNPKNAEGDLLISVAFYALLYAFYSNKKKYNIKYLLSLPLSKSQILIMKVTSDFIFFVPAMVLSLLGIIYSDFPFSPFLLLVVLFEMVIIVSLVMFDSDIEQPRLENARASFFNRLVYVRKAVDFGFLAIFVLFSALAIENFPLSLVLKQYFIILVLGVVIFLKYNKSLKLIRDESLSYFVFKREIKGMGIKFAVLCVPVLAALFASSLIKSPHAGNKLFALIEKGDLKKVESYLNKAKSSKEKITTYPKGSFSAALVAIESGEVEILNKLISAGHTIDWSESITEGHKKGKFPIHLAIGSKNPEMVKTLIKINPNSVNIITKSGNSPLMMATSQCAPEMMDALLTSKSIKMDVSNSEGQTALIISSKNNCSVAIVLLVNAGADIMHFDKDKKSAMDYSRYRKISYYMKRNMTKDQLALDQKSSEDKPVDKKRSIASEVSNKINKKDEEDNFIMKLLKNRLKNRVKDEVKE